MEQISSDELNMKDEDNDEYANDSMEEERQLKEAIRKSALGGLNDKFSSQTTTEANTPVSSVPRRMNGNGKGKGRGGASNTSGTSTQRSTRESTPVRSRGKRKAAISSAESKLSLAF